MLYGLFDHLHVLPTSLRDWPPVADLTVPNIQQKFTNFIKLINRHEGVGVSTQDTIKHSLLSFRYLFIHKSSCVSQRQWLHLRLDVVQEGDF